MPGYHSVGAKGAVGPRRKLLRREGGSFVLRRQGGNFSGVTTAAKQPAFIRPSVAHRCVVHVCLPVSTWDQGISFVAGSPIDIDLGDRGDGTKHRTKPWRLALELGECSHHIKAVTFIGLIIIFSVPLSTASLPKIPPAGYWPE